MSESHEQSPEIGKAKRESLLVRGRRLLGGFIVFGGGSAALVGLEQGGNVPLIGVGAFVMGVGAWLADLIEWPEKR